MTKKILITSALLYANGSLHFGHLAGAYLPADCYARFMRFDGNEVLFLSGSDEYGAAITMSAEKENRSPKEHVDFYYKQALKAFEQFNFSFDHYSRTTWHRHQETVIQFFEDMLEQGYVEKKSTKQLFSEKEQKFLADRYVEGTCPKCHYPNARGDECPKCGASFETSELIKPRSKMTQSPLILKETDHYFFRLDLFKDQLKEWIKGKDWKPQVLNMAMQYIEDAKPRSITRDLNWGIAVPGEKDKVFYVWYDAPIGYISAAKDWAENVAKDPKAWENFWLDPKTKYVQFIGKDNIPFHSVFFPAMVMGQKQPYKQVDELPANAFFHYEGKKFSKSEGWFIELDDFFKHYSSDQIRYYLAANAPESDDSEFVWKDFQNRINADLVGKFGNFVNRTLTFIFQKMDGKIKESDTNQGEGEDRAFKSELNQLTQKIKQAYETFHLRKVTQLIMEMASVCNIYFDKTKPWEVFKTDPARAEQILAHCAIGIKNLAICAYPIIPQSCETIWKLLGFDNNLTDAFFDERLMVRFKKGQQILKPQILFSKIEDDRIKEEINQLKKPIVACGKEMIDYQSFEKIDLRVATIIQAEALAKSDKLLKIQLELGSEIRTVVSGIKKHYDPAKLIGKKVILVANLKPAKIMGVESHGMILAASQDELLELPTIENLPSGSKVS